eukprot:CFRG7300T1
MSGILRKVKGPLSYENTVLHDEDLQTLINGWLGDRALSFFFEYLEVEVYSNHSDIGFISPVVVHYVRSITSRSQRSDLEEFLIPLGLSARNLILLPINDNNDMYEVGGTHWSLLVFDRTNNTFNHYDSMGQYNWPSAVCLAETLSPYMGGHSKLVNCICPSQTNGSDCGVYVMAFAEEIVRAYTEGKTIGTYLSNITPSTIRQMRRRVLELIVTLAKPCTMI